MRIPPHHIEAELQSKFPAIREFFLYGSISKDGSYYDPFSTTYKRPNFGPETDYDFAVDYSPEVERMFMESGWMWKDQLDYQDCCTERVFEGVVLGEKVQISLRTKFVDFKAAWLSIPSSLYWTILNKRSPQYVGPELVKEYINSLVWLHEGIYSKYDLDKYL